MMKDSDSDAASRTSTFSSDKHVSKASIIVVASASDTPKRLRDKNMTRTGIATKRMRHDYCGTQ